MHFRGDSLTYDTLESIHKTITGIRQFHSMRMIPGPSGIMCTTAVQMREFSCSCQDCMTGAECEDETQILNPWKIAHIELKNSVPLPVNPLAVLPVINDREDDGNWDFFEN